MSRGKASSLASSEGKSELLGATRRFVDVSDFKAASAFLGLLDLDGPGGPGGFTVLECTAIADGKNWHDEENQNVTV